MYTRTIMRAILLIQSIIILLGAYYIYTLSHVTKVELSPVPVVQMVPTSTPNKLREGYTPPTTQPPKDTPVIQATTSSITGPSDAGMEYPTN